MATTSLIIIFFISILAGMVGSMLGLGGGSFVVPALTLAFGVDIKTAVTASAVSVIATSTGAAVAYLRDRLTNTRIAVLLEVGTTVGALSGALISALINQRVLFILFGLIMTYSAYGMFRARKTELPAGVFPDSLSRRLKLEGSYYDQALGRQVEYKVARTLPGLAVMYFAGMISALLGLGGGAFKVLAMDQFMRLPIKVSTATSNFMIGVTAATGSLVYFMRGEIKPAIAAPVALGVLAGALLGTRIMVRLKGTTLRLLFIPVLLFVAAQMIWKGVGL